MKNKYFLFLIGFLFILNIYAWQEVFISANDGNLLKVYFLNVGQGDSAFVEIPQKHQILIDGGPNSAVLEQLQKIMPFFDRTIDMIILTHPEKDHMQGLMDVLQRYKVNYILWTGIVRDSPEYQKWIDDLAKEQKQGARIITINFGQTIKSGKVKIDILYPLKNLADVKLEDSNDSSVVSHLVFNENSFLFTGDMSSKTEKELVNENIDVKSDVLKVAHHGSKYSTSDIFLEKVEPKIAIISVGKNSYGHPTPETLQKLENFGIHILRTDNEGNIEIVSDGKNIYINKK
jgi:competence protein ComEC